MAIEVQISDVNAMAGLLWAVIVGGLAWFGVMLLLQGVVFIFQTILEAFKSDGF